MTSIEKWDRRFLALAQTIAGWSKDPSTQVGALIADRDRRIVSMGYNGLPRGVPDDAWCLENRQLKLMLMIHAEDNALLFAREPLNGYTIYTWPLPPCSRCAGKIIQSGIKRVVSVEPSPERLERWGEEFHLASNLYAFADVEEVWLT